MMYLLINSISNKQCTVYGPVMDDLELSSKVTTYQKKGVSINIAGCQEEPFSREDIKDFETQQDTKCVSNTHFSFDER